MNFDFFNSTRLITGKGCIEKNSSLLRALGKKCLIVTGGSSARKSGALQDVEATLKHEGISYILFDKVQPNPLLSVAKEAGDLARAQGAEFLIAIGGGSPMDSAKASAVYAANEMPLMDVYKKEWPRLAMPIVAVGTTAGTGSEVGSTAVMTTPEGYKKSISRADLFPALAFGDAAYTMSLPLSITVSTALDALSHALEGFFAIAANQISDLFAVEAISVLARQLEKLRGASDASGISFEDREQLYYGSIAAGYTLARCGTCYCHALGYHLTEEHGVPHGTACTVFLPGFLRRAQRLIPDRVQVLEERSGYPLENLCRLAEDLLPSLDIALSDHTIQAVAERQATSTGFLRTAPEGFTAEEAVFEMTRLFGKP